MIQFKTIQSLTGDEIKIRTEVFMHEQGFKNEYDEIDKIAYHTILYKDHKPEGCCRMYWNEEENSYVIGRLAVYKEYRKQGLGAALIKEKERIIKWRLHGKTAKLLAQVEKKGFYEKLGYKAYGKEVDDEGCPHIWMEKNL